MVVPYEGHSAGFQHCAVHPLICCNYRYTAGPSMRDLLGCSSFSVRYTSPVIVPVVRCSGVDVMDRYFRNRPRKIVFHSGPPTVPADAAAVKEK